MHFVPTGLAPTAPRKTMPLIVYFAEQVIFVFKTSIPFRVIFKKPLGTNLWHNISFILHMEIVSINKQSECSAKQTLVIAKLKNDWNVFKATKWQFIRNHPEIFWNFENGSAA